MGRGSGTPGVEGGAVIQRLGSARRLSFDSNALIYYLNWVEPYKASMQGVLDEIRLGRKEGVISVVTEIEVLVQPLRDGTGTDVERAKALMDARGMQVVGLDRDIARETAELRARTGLRLPDAAIVATALVTGCDALIGNDVRCAQRVTEVPYVLLDDLVKEKQA